ncbi:cation:proton antiporter [Caldimonas thermodepolymerans]|uniref:cation:proton antiporter n=1 Tax=Caldimonas thermodepolymerans TaxID=215580 RepID=UPI00249238C3|nr:monovalent cation/H(+) antiporter subunit G [Caldimonas thermodepolymerans]
MPPWTEFVVAALLLASGVMVLLSGLGLAQLRDFFLRMHAPALTSTLGAWLVTFASITHFSSTGQGLKLHVWLIIIVLSISAPVTTVVLARAALFRRRQAGDPLPPPLYERARGPEKG